MPNKSNKSEYLKCDKCKKKKLFDDIAYIGPSDLITYSSKHNSLIICNDCFKNDK